MSSLACLEGPNGDARLGGAYVHRLVAAWLVTLALLLGACGNNTTLPNLPKPVPATTLGVGDEFELRIVGEEKLPPDYTIAADGTVDLPYVDRVQVEGLEPQEIARKVHDLLVEEKVLMRPNVSVVVKKYNSKRIEVQGAVKNPNSLPLEPGMTLVGVISRAGGLTPLANKQSVTIRRTTKDGRVVAASVSYAAIIDNEIPDVPLQAGDSIYVNERAF